MVLPTTLVNSITLCLLPIPRDRLLQLPHNALAYQGLVNKGLHPGCSNAGLQLRLNAAMGKALVGRMCQAMLQLVYWCPLFGERGVYRYCLCRKEQGSSRAGVTGDDFGVILLMPVGLVVLNLSG